MQRRQSTVISAQGKRNDLIQQAKDRAATATQRQQQQQQQQQQQDKQVVGAPSNDGTAEGTAEEVAVEQHLQQQQYVQQVRITAQSTCMMLDCAIVICNCDHNVNCTTL
jgi:hypothetical protein